MRVSYNALPRAAGSLSHSMWNPMPRHGGLCLGLAKCNEQFQVIMNLLRFGAVM